MMHSTPRVFVGATTVQVRGMRCAHCPRVVESAVSRPDSVRDVTAKLSTGLVTIHVDRPTDRADIAAAIDNAGYTIVP